MSSTPPLLTPASGKSVYFDAPLAHFASSEDKMLSTTNTPLTAMLAEQEATKPAPTTTETDSGASPEYTANGVAPVSDAKAPIVDTTVGEVKTAESAVTSPVSDTFSAAPESVAPSSSYKSGSILSPVSGAAAGSAFGNGAVTSGPNATPEVPDSVHLRARVAETAIPEKDAKRITKAELKEGKRLSKILKSEGKAEAAAMATLTKELAQLQKIQSAAIKREAKAHSKHASALSASHKAESKYLKMKAKFDKAHADATSKEEALEKERENAREVSARTAEKAQEVEKLRTTKATDDRERANKIAELTRTA